MPTRTSGPAPAVSSRDRATRAHIVAGREILVFDDLFTPAEIETVHRFASRLDYCLNDYDAAGTEYSKHWKHEGIAARAAETPFFCEFVSLTFRCFPERELRLARLHFNLHLYGDLQLPHVDGDGQSVTLLYYVNQRWERNWMGETVFYESNGEPSLVIAPRPGRVVLFEGAIEHRAGVPQRECFEPRMSIALKFTAPEPPAPRLHSTPRRRRAAR